MLKSLSLLNLAKQLQILNCCKIIGAIYTFIGLIQEGVHKKYLEVFLWKCHLPLQTV
jgi:hypothetical protein